MRKPFFAFAKKDRPRSAVQQQIRGMAEKFVDTISIFNRKRNPIEMIISGFAKIFLEQIDEIL